MRPIPIDTALLHSDLLGAALGDPASWSTWLAFLRAAFGIPLDAADAVAFAQVAGDRSPPAERVKELWAIVGRRGGKSRMAAAVAVYLGLFHEHRLAPGEAGHISVISPTARQSRVVFNYALGFIERSPILRQEILSHTADEIRLRGDIIIGVQSGSFRSVRGRTLVAAIMDEVSFLRDESSAGATDIESYRGVLPALATTGGMLIGITSAYRRTGLAYQKFRDYHGQDDPHVLVVRGGTRDFNPTLPEGVIARAEASDPESAASEWHSEFRSDLSTFLDDTLVNAAIREDRPPEWPPRPNIGYRMAVDPSGGRSDGFAAAIGHVEGQRISVDAVRLRAPPFDPADVVREFAALARSYGITTVTGDNYGAEWVAGAFRSAGLSFQRSDMPASGLYLEALPLFARGLVEIPNHPVLVRELRQLERRTGRVGRDTVSHPPRGHDDAANAVALLLRTLLKPAGQYGGRYIGVDGRTYPMTPPQPRYFSPPPEWRTNPGLMRSAGPPITRR